MASAHWLQDGRKGRPYRAVCLCRSLLSLLQAVLAAIPPWVEAGKVQIRTLLVGVIKPESPATAAAILASNDPAKTWHDYEQSNGKMALTIPKAIPPEKMKMLNVNQQLMDDLGANVTPAIYYMNKDNMLQQVVGLPDKEKLHIMMGEKSNSIPQWRLAEATAGATVDDKIY
ncbi:thiol:disulfide interchange protein DsbG [Klebsiella pneumoniae subsp. pneumoniae]|nr:thiol:disulfide interchange protein DsbG [Klebsiella pneumoniae subsp. pneumoniae]